MRLKMGSLRDCVAGQVFGDYLRGKRALGIHTSEEAVNCGICPLGNKLSAKELTKAWREEIGAEIPFHEYYKEAYPYDLSCEALDIDEETHQEITARIFDGENYIEP